MTWSQDAADFSNRPAPVTFARLKDAAAASLAIGSLSLSLIVSLTALSIKVGAAMPFPA